MLSTSYSQVPSFLHHLFQYGGAVEGKHLALIVFDEVVVFFLTSLAALKIVLH